MWYKYCSICGKRYKMGSACCKPTIKKESWKKRIYNSTSWKRLRAYALVETPYCVRCLKKYGYLQRDRLQLHHIKSLNNYPELAFDKSNLIVVCQTCNLELADKNKLDF